MKRVTQHGFTMVELLIALVIFSIVIAQAFAMFGVQHVTQAKTGRALEIQQDVRLVSDAVMFDVRQAGFLVPRVAGIASRDGGAGGPDALCVSDSSVLAEAEVTAALNHFDRAGISAVAAGATAVTIAAGHLDIDNDGNDDFSVGAGIIISDGVNSHCARVGPAIAGNSVQFTPAAPVAIAATGRAVPAAIWQIAAGTNNLTRNGLQLSSQIEDLQVEFGVDDDGDGQFTADEFPIDSLNENSPFNSDPSEIRQVRVSVVARTDAQDDDVLGGGPPAVANHTGGAVGTADGFRRRLITTSVLPRNLL